MYLTLDSRDAEPGPLQGVLRFPLESPLRQVAKVEWLALEINSSQQIHLDTEERLYFSEDLRFFEAVVPRGCYTMDSLRVAVEGAMQSARCMHDGQGVANSYEIKLLPDSKRVCIAGSGDVPFVIHLFHESVDIPHLQRIGGGHWKATFLCSEISPILRGNVVEFFHPSTTPTKAQVLHAMGNSVVIRRLEGPEIFDGEKWTMRPWCRSSLLSELLGLPAVDQISSMKVPVLSCHGFGQLMVSTKGLHGLGKGDRVILDGIEGLMGSEARVTEVKSEQQVTLLMENFLPKGKLTVSCRGEVVEVDGEPQILEVKGNEVVMRLDFLGKKLGDEWVSVKLLPPFPWEICTRAKAFAKQANQSFVIKLVMPPPVVTLDASLTRMAVVGVKTMIFDKRVLLMRLWLALTEAFGVSTNRVSVFGRAQVKEGGFLTSADHSLVGTAEFHPPLEKVAFVDVGFSTSTSPDKPVPLHLLGEYSMLLRIQALR